MYRRSDDGSFNRWDVQSVVTVGASAAATNVTSAKILGIHTDGEIYLTSLHLQVPLSALLTILN